MMFGKMLDLVALKVPDGCRFRDASGNMRIASKPRQSRAASTNKS